MDALALASEFPAASREAWLALVERVLKGQDFERKLVGRTRDGIRIEPLYAKADEPAAIVTRGATPWRIAARVDHPDSGTANSLALADLEGGADTLVLAGMASRTARGFGVAFGDVDGLDRTLAGVDLGLIQVRLEAGPDGREAADALLGLIERRGLSLGALDLDLGLDPIGAAARQGRLSAPWPVVARRLSSRLDALAPHGFAGSLVLADGRPYHEAGAGEAQELAAVMSTALAYLRALEAGGHEISAARDAISFALVADADVFVTVAKLRAARRLWAEVEAASGLAPMPMRLHAETSWRMMTRRDPYVNLLRGTLACFAAGIGGADGVAVLPFTSALGLPDTFARRLARNTQVVLQEEASLWRVADPFAGSGALETLSDELATRAWALFQEIEREGGIVASLAAGALQGRIATTSAARQNAVATRRDPIVGTSEFPNLGEDAVSVLLPAPAVVRDSPDLAASDAGDQPRFPALPSERSAEPYERLRERSDHRLATTGRRPRVFLANLGSVAAHSARTGFARNAFEACGIEAVGEDGVTLALLGDAFARSGAAIACICASDEMYRQDATRAAETLRRAGASRLYLAGRPEALDGDALRQAGVTGFVHIGTDLPELAREIWASSS